MKRKQGFATSSLFFRSQRRTSGRDPRWGRSPHLGLDPQGSANRCAHRPPRPAHRCARARGLKNQRRTPVKTLIKISNALPVPPPGSTLFFLLLRRNRVFRTRPHAGPRSRRDHFRFAPHPTSGFSIHIRFAPNFRFRRSLPVATTSGLRYASGHDRIRTQQIPTQPLPGFGFAQNTSQDLVVTLFYHYLTQTSPTTKLRRFYVMTYLRRFILMTYLRRFFLMTYPRHPPWSTNRDPYFFVMTFVHSF